MEKCTPKEKMAEPEIGTRKACVEHEQDIWKKKNSI
jgi:hypothetical protein